MVILKVENNFRSLDSKIYKTKKKNIYQRLSTSLAFIKILKINSLNDYCKIQLKILILDCQHMIHL